MKLVIIESPYSGPTPADIESNVNYARACMRDSLSRGEFPLASHLLYTQPGILDDAVPEQRKQGIDAGFHWAQAADVIAFYTDRGWSTGMREALAFHSNHRDEIELRALDGPVRHPA